MNDDIKLPILALQLKPELNFSVYQLSDKLRERGWIVPAYTLPPNAEKIEVLRIVIRENFSRDMANMLLNDMNHYAKELSGLEKEKKKSNNNNQIHKHIC